MTTTEEDARSDREVFITDAITSAQEMNLNISIGWITGIGGGLKVAASDVRIHAGGIVIEFYESGQHTELWAPFESILNIGVLLP